MREVDLVVRGGAVVTSDPDFTVHPAADVAIDGGRFVEIGPELQLMGRRELDASDAVVIPGLINAHTHGCLLRGLYEDKPLHEWLQNLCFPMEQRLLPAHTTAAAHMNQLEMIRGGTTTFVDMYRHPTAVAEVVEKSGLRAILCPQVMELGSGRGETWEEAERFLRARAGETGHISTWIGPHAPYTVTGEGYRRAARLAAELGLRVKTHLCETQFEVDLIQQREGLGPVEWLDSLGVLEGLVAAHAVVLSESDRNLLARRGAAIVHNPTSNMKLASGVAEVGAATASNIPLGLGTDSVLSNNKLDMIQEMRAAALLQKSATGDAAALPAQEALHMATLGGARALGLEEEIGSVEVGKRADLAVIDFAAPHLWPWLRGVTGDNTVSQIVYASNASDVIHTVVDGRVLMKDREVLTLDAGQAREQVQQAATELLGFIGNHHIRSKE